MGKKDISEIDALREMRCFRRMGEADLKLILRYSSHVTYRKQRVLFYQSEPARKVFLILSGTVSRLKYRSDESCLSIGTRERGDWLGLAEILLGCPYMYDSVAETQTDVLAFSVSSFNDVMKIRGMKEFFLEYQAKSLYVLHSQIELNLPLHKLIQHVITYACRKPDGFSYLVATQDEIAQAIGTTRETVNKYLQSLQREGLLSVARGRIEIPKIDQLSEKLL